MRVFILISLLCSIAFSAPVLNGAEYTQIVTINHVQVAETSSDFLYQLKIPRVGALLTAVESADDVAFTNVNDTTRRARWVVYTPDTIFIYSHIAVSSTVDTSYMLQYGKALNEINSSATFTNCGITNFWGMDDASGNTVIDYAGGVNGTVNSPATIGNSGLFGKSAEFTASTLGAILTSKTLTYSAGLYIETVIYPVFTGNDVHVIAGDWLSSGVGGSLCYDNSGKLMFFTSATGAPTSNVTIQNSAWAMAGMWFDALATNPVFVYNGATDKRIAQSPITGANTFAIGNRISPNTAHSGSGKIDQVAIYTSGVSAGMIADRFNMLFTPSTFSTLGTPLAIDVSAEMGIDTLTFTCSAEGAITYQWFLDGAEMVGETDSVLVTYADSAFYSTVHTLYCLVNSSVISDSWVITTEFSAEMGIDTLRLVCSAENALTYQWYDNNVAVTGETDSVYTIYADSVFYSIKHVIYCLVNGSVISDSWIIRDTSGFLQRLFQRNRGYGRGR